MTEDGVPALPTHRQDLPRLTGARMAPGKGPGHPEVPVLPGSLRTEARKPRCSAVLWVP